MIAVLCQAKILAKKDLRDHRVPIFSMDHSQAIKNIQEMRKCLSITNIFYRGYIRQSSEGRAVLRIEPQLSYLSGLASCNFNKYCRWKYFYINCIKEYPIVHSFVTEERISGGYVDFTPTHSLHRVQGVESLFQLHYYCGLGKWAALGKTNVLVLKSISLTLSVYPGLGLP